MRKIKRRLEANDTVNDFSSLKVLLYLELTFFFLFADQMSEMSKK